MTKYNSTTSNVWDFKSQEQTNNAPQSKWGKPEMFQRQKEQQHDFAEAEIHTSMPPCSNLQHNKSIQIKLTPKEYVFVDNNVKDQM